MRTVPAGWSGRQLLKDVVDLLLLRLQIGHVPIEFVVLGRDLRVRVGDPVRRSSSAAARVTP